MRSLGCVTHKIGKIFSHVKEKFISSIGSRLLEERTRLGLNQAELGSLMGSGPKTVRNWESDSTAPDAAALALFAAHGGDVLYVVTGTRAPLMTAEGDTGAAPLSQSRQLLNRLATLDINPEDADMLVLFARRLAAGQVKKT